MNSELAVIFDMDGVLIDSVGLNWQAYNQVLENHHGARLTDKEISKYVGMSLKDQISLLNKNLSIKIDEASFIRESTGIKQSIFANVKPKKGIVTLLKNLKAASIPMAIGTSSPRSVARNYLVNAGVWSYFDVCIAEEDVDDHKPNPAVYTEAAKRLNMPRAKCIVIEDAPSGIVAAKSAGMQCIAILTAYVPAEELDIADLTVRSAQDLTISKMHSLLSTSSSDR